MSARTKPGALVIGLGLIVLLPFLGVLLFTQGLQHLPHFYGTVDEGRFHWPGVLQFQSSFPVIDYREYPSASGPVYHVLLGWLLVPFGPEIVAARWIHVALTLIALAVVARCLARHQAASSPVLVATGVATVVFSPYFFGTAFNLGADNFAFGLAAAAVCLGTVAIERSSARLWAVTISIAALSMATRQNYAGLLLGLAGLPWILNDDLGRRRWTYSVAPVVVMLALAGLMFWAWHGFVPPRFQGYNQGAGRSLNGLHLGLVFFGSVAILVSPELLMGGQGRMQGREKAVAWVLSSVAALALVLITPTALGEPGSTTMTRSARYDGWAVEILRNLPNPLVFSVWSWLVISVAVYYIVALWKAGSYSRAVVPLVVGMAVALIPGGVVLQRYVESFFLFLLVTEACRRRTSAALHPFVFVPPCVMLLLSLAWLVQAN